MPNNILNNDPMSKRYLPNISVDSVIFGFHNRQLKVLLLRFKNTEMYALPGGFIDKEEDLEDSVKRILSERTGLHDIYLEQFGTFGSKQRAYGEVHKAVAEAIGKTFDPNAWVAQRFVTVCYYALVDFHNTIPSPDPASDLCDWFDINEMPNLMFDHNAIVQQALASLRLMLDYKLVAFNLMPDMFTMNDLQSLYETILGKKLLRTNFQRKMLSLGILERVDKQWTGGAHKAAYLYRFDKNKYEEMQKEEANLSGI